jgi:hypothetical protein
MKPQSAAILDGAERLVSLDLADDPGMYPIISRDPLQFNQRRPSYELKNP